ncbi:MAG: universal stress protein [Ginsengibacter sp.]
MMQTDKRLLEEAEAIDTGAREIEIICDEGDSAEAIVKLAREKSVDFIIVGMKGDGKNVKKYLAALRLLWKEMQYPCNYCPRTRRISNSKNFSLRQ